jgi:hypothetical protein
MGKDNDIRDADEEKERHSTKFCPLGCQEGLIIVELVSMPAGRHRTSNRSSICPKLQSQMSDIITINISAVVNVVQNSSVGRKALVV